MASFLAVPKSTMNVCLNEMIALVSVVCLLRVESGHLVLGAHAPSRCDQGKDTRSSM